MQPILKYSILNFFLFLGLQASYCQNDILEKENKKAIEILKNSATFKVWKGKNNLSDNDIVYPIFHSWESGCIVCVEVIGFPDVFYEFIINNSSKEVKVGEIEDLR